jgi:hypothetical protein
MERKFVPHYRRMLPALLETLQFRSDNRFQPLIEALAVIQRHLGSHHRYFPETVPVEGVVTPAWREKVFEEAEGEYRVNRRYYELCVLEKFQRALKCKEVWVEGSYAFRNPSEDMPGDWSDERRRILPRDESGSAARKAPAILALRCPRAPRRRCTGERPRRWCVQGPS